MIFEKCALGSQAVGVECVEECTGMVCGGRNEE